RLMKSRIGKLHSRPQKNQDIITAIHDVWNAITEYELGQILDSMIARVDAVLTANSRYTKY
ncbi:hypothetical protein B9Z19DRAFT_979337, partial [Tuber borchii]